MLHKCENTLVFIFHMRNMLGPKVRTQGKKMRTSICLTADQLASASFQVKKKKAGKDCKTSARYKNTDTKTQMRYFSKQWADKRQGIQSGLTGKTIYNNYRSKQH